MPSPPDFRALVIKNGTTQNISNSDTLIVGTKVDAAAGQVLSIGDVNATGITIGRAGLPLLTTSFPGPVELLGDVTTVGGTTFTSDATFEGNVTFGNGPADTVTFAASTTVINNIAFGGAPGTYKITNLANGTAPNDAVNKSQLDAATGVSGSGVAAQLAYFTGASAIGSETGVGADALTWDATNNRLGVGTNTPTTTVDVASGQVAIPDGTAAAPAIAFRDDLNTGLYSPTNDIVGVAVNGTEVARFQQFGAGNTPVMLLGTSNVSGAITVDSSDTSGTAGVVMLGHVNAGTVIQESYRGGQFAGVRSRGTKAEPTAVGAGDGLVNMLGAGCYTNFPTVPPAYNYGGLVTVKAEQFYTSTASGGRVEIHTTLNGTDGFTTLGGTATERMRIANDGRVAIGQSGGSIIPAAAGSILTLAGGLTQSAGAVSLTGNAASSFTTSAGDLTLTGGVNLQLAAGFGSAVIVNEFASNVDFRVESQANANMLLVDASQSSVSVGTTGNTHTFNIGTGAASNFSVASGGRIHTYDGTAPLNGQVLIGDTALGNFAKATLTAGTGISITNGAGSVTIAATGAASASDVQVTLDTTTNSVAAGDACYASANPGVVNEANADGVVVNTARALGISVGATANKVSVAGLITCNFDTSLSPVLAVGQPVYLSTTSAGKLTNAWPVTPGLVNAEVGIVTAVTTPAGGALAAQVLWQPKAIIVL